MFTWKRFILTCCALILAGLLFVNLTLPGIARNQAQDWVEKNTGRNLEIGSISINPLTLVVEIRQLTLSEQDHAQIFLSWDVLRIGLSPSTLTQRAPIVRELYLQKPYVHIEKLPGKHFNFSDLIPPADPAKATDDNKPQPGFSINNLIIHNGSLDFDDRSLETAIRHTVRDFELAVPFIGNLPYLVDRPVQPLLKAVINNAPIRLDGTLKPFVEAQEVQIKLAFDNIDLPYYLAYVPIELPVVLKSGRLSFDLDLRYRMEATAAPQLTLGGQIDLTILDIYDRSDKQLFFLPLLRCVLAPSNLLDKDVHIAALNLYNLEAQVNRDADGIWNHERLKGPEPLPAKDEPAVVTAPETIPLKLKIDALTLRDGSVFFKDAMPAGGFASIARGINLDVNGFMLGANNAMALKLDLKTERGETLTTSGEMTIEPLAIALDTRLSHIPLGAYLPYYRTAVAVPLGGTVDAKAHVIVTAEIPFLLRNGQVELTALSVPFNPREGLDVGRIGLNGLSFDLAKNRLEVDNVSASDTRLLVSRDRDGNFSFRSDNLPVLMTAAHPPAGETTDTAPAFNFRIGEFAFSGGNLDFRDRLPEQAAHLKVSDINLVVRDLAAPEKSTSPFELSANLPPKGQLRFDGKLRLAEQRVDLKARLKRFPLLPLAPYLAEETSLILANGTLDANMTARATATPSAFTLGFNGELGVSRLHLLDKKHRADLLKWDNLQIAGIQGELEPLQVTIASVTLSDYFAKVLIDEEAKLNLIEALQKEGALAEKESEAAEMKPASDEAQATPRPKISINTVILQGGQVDFTDRSLPRPFHADMQALGGRISGLSSSADTRAEVDLRGNLRNQSPLSITGTVNPLAEDLFLNLQMNFNDIEMSPFSPYSGTFAGYLIEKGKLNLELDYTIEEGQLKATNKIFLDQFTFGETVESEKATRLPVKLAVALLKDGKGEIHLDIPVYGRLDDPQFSITGIVWTVLKNLLIKVATSPLALLGALVGGGEEDFSTISFAYGSARLTATEEDKLARMAKALAERPSLKIEVKGFIDAENDPEGYRREALAGRIRQAAFIEMTRQQLLPEGSEAGDLEIPAEEYADYLWEVYSEADFPKPRNFIGMTKKLPVAEMEKLLYANTAVDQNTLGQLAMARAIAVQNYLTVTAGLARERVFLTSPDLSVTSEQKGTTQARVELGTTVH